MFPDTCRFCEHVNPPDAKFCNACGGALHLVPCSRCGAVNDVTATSCYQCHNLLAGRGNSAAEVPQPAAEAPKALPRPRTRIIVGTAIFAVISVASYLGYRQASHLGAAQPPGASSRADDRGGSSGAGVNPLGPAQEMGTESAATVKPVIARSKTGDPGKAGQREVQRQDACTDGVAALGLCAPRPKQEGK